MKVSLHQKRHVRYKGTTLCKATGKHCCGSKHSQRFWTSRDWCRSNGAGQRARG